MLFHSYLLLLIEVFKTNEDFVFRYSWLLLSWFEKEVSNSMYLFIPGAFQLFWNKHLPQLRLFKVEYIFNIRTVSGVPSLRNTLLSDTQIVTGEASLPHTCYVTRSRASCHCDGKSHLAFMVLILSCWHLVFYMEWILCAYLTLLWCDKAQSVIYCQWEQTIMGLCMKHWHCQFHPPHPSSISCTSVSLCP